MQVLGHTANVDGIADSVQCTGLPERFNTELPFEGMLEICPVNVSS